MKQYAYVALLATALASPFLVKAQPSIPTPQFVGPGARSGSFPVTTKITHVSVGPNGVNVTFGKKDGPGRWPDNTTPGWKDPLQYSVGFVLQVAGQWFASAPIEYWYGRVDGTGPIQNYSTPTCANGAGQFRCNIFYDQRWDPLQHAVPKAGDAVGVYVVAGDARNDYMPVQERSDIVVITLPAEGQTAEFDFGGDVPPPAVCQDPKANNVGKPLPCTYDVPVPPTPDPRIAELQASVDALARQLSDTNASVVTTQNQLGDLRNLFISLGQKFDSLGAVPKGCKASLNLGATKISIHCELTY